MLLNKYTTFNCQECTLPLEGCVQSKSTPKGHWYTLGLERLSLPANMLQIPSFDYTWLVSPVEMVKVSALVPGFKPNHVCEQLKNSSQPQTWNVLHGLNKATRTSAPLDQEQPSFCVLYSKWDVLCPTCYIDRGFSIVVSFETVSAHYIVVQYVPNSICSIRHSHFDHIVVFCCLFETTSHPPLRMTSNS